MFKLNLFTERLLNLAQSYNGSPRSLCIKADLSSSFISDLKQGKVKKSPSLDTVLKLSEILNVPLSYISGEINYIPTQLPSITKPLKEDFKVLKEQSLSLDKDEEPKHANLYMSVVASDEMQPELTRGNDIWIEPFIPESDQDRELINNLLVHAVKDDGQQAVRRFVNKTNSLNCCDDSDPYLLSEGWEIKGVVRLEVRKIV